MVLSANLSCSHIISSDSLQMPSKWLEANCLGWSGGGDTHIPFSSTVFTYFNFLDSCSFGCWNCMLIKSSFTLFFDHFWILQAWESVYCIRWFAFASNLARSQKLGSCIRRSTACSVASDAIRAAVSWDSVIRVERRLRKTQEAKEQFVTLQELSCVGLAWSTRKLQTSNFTYYYASTMPSIWGDPKERALTSNP